ncbi:MAG TPA: hypothetical protein VE596_18580 [Gaiellaceae bacterium]|jgi:hypothetical protein|nr:hypothetical protein [Gaiellaceae bacterium]
MTVVRRSLLLLAALCAVSGAQAARKPVRAPVTPVGVRPFLLSPSEAPARAYPRTPSFAWKAVRNAAFYEFELGTSNTFNEGSIVFASNTLRAPTVSVPVALPWLTGRPYALYAHVRAIAPTGATSGWSAPYGFNMRWSAVPTKLPGTQYPGLVQWTPVDGASAYDVWFDEPNKIIRTKTNAADEREYYTFHQSSPWPDVVHWRVRAVRKTYGDLPNRLPTVSYGPWSALQTSLNPPLATGPLRDVAAVSDATSTATPAVHRLTPGFVFAGNEVAANPDIAGKPAPLYRVYVFSDSDCVNVVFKGALVGSPAYAPRMSGPLQYPTQRANLFFAPQGYLPDGLEGKTFMADSSKIQTTESDKPQANPASGDTTTPAVPDPSAAPPPPEATSPLPGTPTETGAPVDLWDSGWPNGRYYWTVVAAEPRLAPNLVTYLAAPVHAGDMTIQVNNTLGFAKGGGGLLGDGVTQELVNIKDIVGNTIYASIPVTFDHPVRDRFFIPTDAVEYHDLEMPQDACADGRVQAFGKTNEPAVTTAGAPYVTGLSPTGRLVQAAATRPAFYGSPLVSWKPALGADEYQIQWSRTRYPWRPVDPVTKERYEKLTFATSALLDRQVTAASGTTTRGPLLPGMWWYRVRGLDFSLPGTARAMSWSKPVAVRITKPKFAIVGR